VPYTSSPSQPSGQIRRDATQFVVLLGDQNGDRPTLEDEADYLEPLSVKSAAGGHRCDTLHVRYNLKKAQDSDQAIITSLEYLDTARDLLWNRIVEIRAADDEGNFTRIVGWGRVSSQPLELSKDKQTFELVARLDPFCFGSPLEGFPVLVGGSGGTSTTLDDHVIFNPLIDRLIQGNMSSETSTTDGGEYNYFLDPESVLTSTAQNQHSGETIAMWDMASAVQFLCSWLNNSSPLLVTNPDFGALQTVFANFDSSQLRNAHIPIGTKLPDALDMLLKPYGFWWYLEHSTDDDDPDGESKSTITVFQRGQGTPRQTWIDAEGDPITNDGTNTNAFKCEPSIEPTYNAADGASDLGLFEVTLPLYPAWPASQDKTDITTLAKEALTAKNCDIYRKWVANEAGDYTAAASGNRAAISVPDLAAAFSVSKVQVKRRALHHCISRDTEQHSLGIWVEWWNPGLSAWEKFPEPHSVLKQEAGIYFDGDLPPYFFWYWLNNGFPTSVTSSTWPFGLRVTACLRSDSRRWGRATQTGKSPNSTDATLTLDLSHKFPWRRYAFAGPYVSVLGEIPNAPEGDEIEPESPPSGVDIQTYCETLRDWQQAAQLSTSVALDGADHPEYAIGNVIQKINGREVKLNALIPQSPDDDPRHPQVVGVNYLLGDKQQRIELVLESFRKEEFPELADLGEGRRLHGKAAVHHAGTKKI
jgi:hypothetical protein